MDKIDINRIIDLHQGKLDADELSNLSADLSTDDAYSKFMMTLDELWLEEGWSIQQDINSDKIFIKIKSAISKPSNGKQVKLEQKNSVFKYFWRVAAVLIFGLVAYGTTQLYLDSNFDKLADTVVKAENGTKKRIKLADGTEVFLNSGSSLFYKDNYGKKTRTVFLKGEAYFSVEKNQDVPFVVNTDEISVLVTGTSFNIEAYNDLTELRTTLHTGNIKLTERKLLNPISIDLKPGEQAVFNKELEKISLKPVEAYSYCAWKEGKIIFEDVKLSEVVKKLNRWFNVNIQILDNEIKDYKYTLEFDHSGLDEVLLIMSEITPIKYHYEGADVQISLDEERNQMLYKNSVPM